MDVSLPIRTVIPSLDGPVLQTLAVSTVPTSLTRVHQRAGTGSLSGIRKVLKRLVEHGLVREVPGGYVLNRDHVAAPAVLLLAQLHGEAASRITEWLRDRPEDVLAAGLFGSVARRDGGTTSDVDIVVVTASPADPELADDLADAIERWTGNRGQVVLLTREEAEQLRDQRRSIVASWHSDLQMLLGDRSTVLG
jgi:predicted nucleotidyltransferase